MKVQPYFLLLCLVPIALTGHFYTPERVAFPALCEKHFTDTRKYTMHTWIEPVSQETIKEFAPYLRYLPKPYEADCYGCSGCGGMRLSRREEVRLPFEHPKFAYDELTKLHQQVRYGTLETCRHRGSERCDSFCWDGGYFRRLNKKYLPFFKELLVYNSQNELCRCFWHERNEKAVSINNFVYRFIHSLIEQKLIQSDFSPHWVSQEIRFDRKGRSYGKEYFPNSHGMASSLATYLFFYSHYQQMLADVVVSIDQHAGDPLQSIVAKEQVYSTLEDLHAKFLPLYERCLKLHPHPKIYLERSLMNMQVGEARQALDDLLAMQALAQTDKFRDFDLLTDSYYCQLGKVYTALHRNDEAIEAYNCAQPNETIYFLRAVAQFERGHFLEACVDYEHSKRADPLSSVPHKASDDFREGLIKGLKETEKGRRAGSPQRAYWVLLKNSISVEAAQAFANAAEEVGRSFSFGNSPIAELPEELIELLNSYNLLSDMEKGERLGALIGKYGLAPFSKVKKISQVEALKKLEEANQICNFAALSHSKAYLEEMMELVSTKERS